MDNEQEDQFAQGAVQFCCSPVQQMAHALASSLTKSITADDAEGEEGPSFLPPFANAENRALDAQIRVSDSTTLVSVKCLQCCAGPDSLHATHAYHQ
jgi:hypothetical protein